MYKNVFKRVAWQLNQYCFKKNHLYIPFFSLFLNHERHDQRNRVTTALGAKQEGLTIVHFLNKLIVSCKEAVRFPFLWGGGGGGGGYF